MMRSGLRPSNTTPRPPFSPPIRRSSSSSTSSKNSVHCLSAPRTAIGISWRVKPGASTSTIASEGSPSLPSASRVRATTSTASASSTPEMNVFWPLSRKRPFSRRSEVARLCELVPASASVIAKAIFVVPLPIPRSQRSFWTAVPCRARMLPTIAGETTISSSAQPAAEISSPTHDSAVIPRPPPSYSSGMLTPRYPREASASHSSLGGSPASRLRCMYSRPKPPQMPATASRSSVSSCEGTSDRAAAAAVVDMAADPNGIAGAAFRRLRRPSCECATRRARGTRRARRPRREPPCPVTSRPSHRGRRRRAQG